MKNRPPKLLRGVKSVKDLRALYFESVKPLLNELTIEALKDSIAAEEHVNIIIYTDISTKTGERVIVFILEKNLEKELDTSN